MLRLFLIGFVSIAILNCCTPITSERWTDSIAHLSRPFRQPTAPIHELLRSIERNDQSALRTVTHQTRQAAALPLLINAWQQVHQPPMIILGPYRLSDWPLPGTRLTIPLQLACHHGKERFEITVILTIRGWQVTEIRHSSHDVPEASAFKK
ncbi:hypothetical protein [Chloroflexus sp.]|uniref:hypothetical protein n=1 Tax=Chloroflexus sp. TaxID=1904827 RepID=UPI002ADDF6FB|nr:hypothetical protein [Chloroflexus sp.]